MKKSLKKQIILACLLLLFPLLSFSAISFEFEIHGVDDAKALSNIEKRFTIVKDDWSEPLSDAQTENFMQDAPENILKAMQPFGYFKPHVKSHLQKKGKNWTAVFNVTPGPLLKVTHLRLNIEGAGKQNDAFQKAIKEYPLQVGDTLLSKPYQKAKQLFYKISEEQGYLDTEIESEIRINLATYTAIIIITIKTGERYYFGDILFDGSGYDNDFLHRFVKIKSGEPYSSQQLLDLQEALSGSPFFSSVRIDPLIEEKKQCHVPIKIYITPKKPHLYTAGVGYSTDVGPRATLGWDWRRVTSTGHQLQNLIQASPRQGIVESRYTIPGHDPSVDQYFASLSGNYLNTDNGDSIWGEGKIGSIRMWHGWKRQLAINALFSRNFNFTDQEAEYAITTYPSFILSKIRRNDVLNPTSGYDISFLVRGALKDLLSEFTFFQAKLDMKFLKPLSETNYLVLHGAIGTTKVDDYNKLPVSLRFYAGGSQSIRGYRYESIGPGRHLLETSIEFRHRFSKKWTGGVFFDAGNASSEGFTNNIKRGAGINIIRNTRIGPIQFGIARGIDRPSRSFKFIFRMGPEL